MQELCSESFNYIEPLLMENYGNVRGRMRLKLDEDENNMFADINLSPNSGQWLTNINADMHTYTEATAQEKEEIAKYMAVKRASIMEKLRPSMPFVDDLFIIPNDNKIFWWRTDNGEIKVVLAQWGFKMKNKPKNVNVIDMIISQAPAIVQTEVVIHVSYSNGEVAANETFDFTALNNTKKIHTNEQGSYSHGKMMSGQKFSVSNGNKVLDYEVKGGISDYYATFDLYTDYEVMVIDQNHNVMADYEVTIDGKPYTTDSEGKVIKGNELLTPNKKIVVGARDGQPVEFVLNRRPEDNKFIYQIRKEVPVTPPKTTSYTVQVVNQDGKPVGSYDVMINGKGSVTDGNGFVKVGNVAMSDINTIMVEAKGGAPAMFTLDENAANNNFIYRIEEAEEMVSVRLLNFDGSPLDNITVYIDVDKKTTLTATTDADGVVTFPAKSFSTKRKPKIRFNVTEEYQERKRQQKKEQKEQEKNAKKKQ